MGAFHWLLLLFFSVPLLEIYLLLKVGGTIGALPTVGLVVLTAVLGAALMRHQGLATIARVQASLDRGELPATALLEGVLILVAGALLLTPGFFTDALGFACLIPPLRARVVASAVRRMAVHRAQAAGGGPGERRTLEGEYWREDE